MSGEREEPCGFIPPSGGMPDVALIPVAGIEDSRMTIVLWRTSTVLALREITARVPRRYGSGAHGARRTQGPPDKNVGTTRMR